MTFSSYVGIGIGIVFVAVLFLFPHWLNKRYPYPPVIEDWKPYRTKHTVMVREHGWMKDYHRRGWWYR